MRWLSGSGSKLLLAAAAFWLAPPALAQAAPAAAPAAAAEAAAAAQRCRSADLESERRCYEQAMMIRLRESGAAAALALLGALAAIDEDVAREGHMHAHGIGIAALAAPEEVGRVFASCTPSFQSGCYHGVIQSYFLALQRQGGATTTESVDAVCADQREPQGSGWLLFQCTHGLGHGLAILHRHDLPVALASCDLLSRAWERENCYGGAFMESIVNATHPHHAVADHAGQAGQAGAHDHHAAPAGGHDHHGPQAGGGHAGHGAPARPAFRALDPDDLHYPCSIMAEKYLNACYTIQTAAFLHHSGRDWRRAAAECSRAPQGARETCFISLGRDVSTVAATDPREGVRLCGHAEEAFRPACNVGVVTSLINLEADPATGLPYCRLVDAAASKRACYRAIGEQASGLADGASRRREACGRAEEDYVQICLTGLVPEAAAAPGAGG